MKRPTFPALFLSIGVLTAAACNSAVPTTPTASTTLEMPASALPSQTPAFSFDPCSPEYIDKTVRPLNDLMRQFHSYAALASYVMHSELVKVIPVLEAVRQATEEQVVPSCLTDLRRYALTYMDAVIQFLTDLPSTPEVAAVATGIAQTRQLDDQYSHELTRLLGGTPAAPATPTAGPALPVATP